MSTLLIAKIAITICVVGIVILSGFISWAINKIHINKIKLLSLLIHMYALYGLAWGVDTYRAKHDILLDYIQGKCQVDIISVTPDGKIHEIDYHYIKD